MSRWQTQMLPGALALAGLVLTFAACRIPGHACGAARKAGSSPGGRTKDQVRSAYDRLPLSFEANAGQADAQVKFLARSRGCTLWLTGTEAVLRLRSAGKEWKKGAKGEVAGHPHTPTPPYSHTTSAKAASGILRMRLSGSNADASVEGAEPLPGRTNYFIGTDPSRWRAGIKTFAKVRYEEVYPGTDLVYYGTQGQLEYDFVLQPHADPARVQFRLEGAQQVKTDARGDLTLFVGRLPVRQQKPVAYQEVKGVRKEVAASYRLLGGTQIGFRLAAYDRSRPLVIDPIIKYSTYLGGNAADEGQDITVGTDGSAYVTGQTDSSNFLAQNPSQGDKGSTDAFVARLNPAGTALLYSTYLGGAGSDTGAGIALGITDEAYVTGTTDSRDFPTTAGAFDTTFNGTADGSPDAFVTKLNNTGNLLVYSTYLGGTASEAGFGIAVDAQADAFVTGNTYSTNFPTANAVQNAPGDNDPNVPDAFVTSLNETGSGLLFSTYLGGDGYDEGDAIAVQRWNGPSDAVVTGVTFSTNFPTTATRFQGDQPKADAFVTRYNFDGSALDYSTYLGGSENESGLGVVIGPTDDKILVTGGTTSPNFPLKGQFQGDQPGMDAFVTRLDPDASGAASLLSSTYLGGSADDQGTDVAVDLLGQIFVTGWTKSANFPTKNPVQAALSGPQDAFVTVLNPAGNAAVWSTFLGGSATDQGNGIAVEPFFEALFPHGTTPATTGHAYVTGITGSLDFPTHTPIMTDPGDGAEDAFVTKIGPLIARPGPVFAAPNSSTSIRVSWVDNSNNEKGFKIFQGLSGQFFPVGTTGPNVTTFVDTGANRRTDYQYKVVAFNEEGESDFSDKASAKPGRRLTGKLQVTPGRLNFGSLRAGRSRTRTLKLKNIGTAPLFVSVEGVDSPFVITDLPAGGFSLARGKSRTLHVRFAPVANGTFRDSALVRLITPGLTTRSVPLIGKGVGGPGPIP
jgi:hypothetical protein